MQTKNKNLYIVDIIKFVCAILVLLIHTAPFSSLSSALDMGFRNTVATIAVPFFFSTSGYFFCKKLFLAQAEERKRVFVKTEKRLVFLYGFYSLVYLPFVVKGWVDNGFSLNSILSYVYNFFVVGSYSTIWYLLASIVAVYLCYLSVTKLGFNKGFVLALAFYAFGCLISSYYGAIEGFPVCKAVADGYYRCFSSVKNGVLFGWIYMMIGGCLAKNEADGSVGAKGKMPWVILALSFVLLVIEAVGQYVLGWATKGVDLKLSLLLVAWALLSAIFRMLEPKLGQHPCITKHAGLWVHLRKLSVLIFLLQRIPLTFFGQYIYIYKLSSFVYTLVVFVITLLLAELIIWLSTKIKFFKYIY